MVSQQSAEEQGSGLYPVELIYGQPSNPIPLPGDTFGWTVSAEADGKEWRCGLMASAPLPGFLGLQETGGGRWVARATFTAADPMSDTEWKRVCDRLYLRGPTQVAILPAWGRGD